MNANGGDSYVNHNANIYGSEGNLIEFKITNATHSTALAHAGLYCPANQEGSILCEFHCLGPSDCRDLNIITQNGLSDVSVHCEGTTGCVDVGVYTRSTVCQMQWNGDAWECIDRYVSISSFLSTYTYLSKPTLTYFEYIFICK